MKTIHRFALKPGYQTIDLNLLAQPLTVQVKNGEPSLWVLLDTEREIMPHAIYVVPTGDGLDQTIGRYIGTFQLPEDALVFHVFTGPGW